MLRAVVISVLSAGILTSGSVAAGLCSTGPAPARAGLPQRRHTSAERLSSPTAPGHIGRAAQGGTQKDCCRGLAACGCDCVMAQDPCPEPTPKMAPGDPVDPATASGQSPPIPLRYTCEALRGPVDVQALPPPDLLSLTLRLRI